MIQLLEIFPDTCLFVRDILIIPSPKGVDSRAFLYGKRIFAAERVNSGRFILGKQAPEAGRGVSLCKVGGLQKPRRHFDSRGREGHLRVRASACWIFGRYVLNVSEAGSSCPVCCRFSMIPRALRRAARSLSRSFSV